MYEPEVLLLDEATSALDTHNKKKIEEIIFKLADKGLPFCGLHIVMTKVCVILSVESQLLTVRYRVMRS